MGLRRRVALVGTSIFACIASIVACSSGEAIAPDAGAPPVGAGSDGGIDSSRPKDAGRDARGPLGPAVVVAPDALGCPGQVRVDGPAIDTSTWPLIRERPEAGLLSFADGTFGAVVMEYDVVAARLGPRLELLASYPIAPLDLPRPGVTGGAPHVRNGSMTGVGLAGGVGNTDAVAGRYFSYDFAKGESWTMAYDETVDGRVVSRGATTGDEKTSFAWSRVVDEAGSSVWRRAFGASAWQKTDLSAIPETQWEEGGATHVFDGTNDVVVAADGTVVRQSVVPMIENTVSPCSFGQVVRTGSAFITLRSIRRLPCSDPGANAVPSEYWGHLDGDPVGRKLGEATPDENRRNLLQFLWGHGVDAVVRHDTTDGTKFVAHLQRLGPRLEPLGDVVSITERGRPSRSKLIPVKGGYFWFVGRVESGNTILQSAYKLVCE